jgi:proteasome alpha subunit
MELNMVTPYDWQENIGHRSRFVEARLETGIPVAAASIPEGILVASFRYQASKLYEIYDRLLYSAIGMQSDVEAVRVAAVEFCHQEGYRRSEDDVTVQRVATHLSQPIKQAFGDMRISPMVVRALFAEVGETVDQDKYYAIDFDGDYSVYKHKFFLAGSPEAGQTMGKAVEGFDFATSNRDDAIAQLREAVVKGMDPDGSKAVAGELPELTFEAAILVRGESRVRRFVRLAGAPD